MLLLLLFLLLLLPVLLFAPGFKAGLGLLSVFFGCACWLLPSAIFAAAVDEAALLLLLLLLCTADPPPGTAAGSSGPAKTMFNMSSLHYVLRMLSMQQVCKPGPARLCSRSCTACAGLLTSRVVITQYW
jgi:hypothetical protein